MDENSMKNFCEMYVFCMKEQNAILNRIAEALEKIAGSNTDNIDNVEECHIIE